MSVSVCPIARVNAPADRVWSFLSEPVNYAFWWDAEAREIEPTGRARSGQKIHAQSVALGIRWNVNVLVEGIEEARHLIHLKTSLPLGITVYNHITCTEVDASTCQVSFG